MNRPSLWPQAIVFFLLCLVACAVEPCDGHSCDQEVTIKEFN
jgi:hypothetical protein